MPVLKNRELVKEFVLPSTKNLPKEDQAIVAMDVSPIKTGDVVGVSQGMTEGEASVRMLYERIKSWNYTDETGNLLPVSFDNVKALDIDDFKFLEGQISGVDSSLDAEKKSKSPEQPEQPVTNGTIPVTSQ